MTFVIFLMITAACLSCKHSESQCIWDVGFHLLEPGSHILHVEINTKDIRARYRKHGCLRCSEILLVLFVGFSGVIGKLNSLWLPIVDLLHFVCWGKFMIVGILLIPFTLPFTTVAGKPLWPLHVAREMSLKYIAFGMGDTPTTPRWPNRFQLVSWLWPISSGAGELAGDGFEAIFWLMRTRRCKDGINAPWTEEMQSLL